MIRSIVVIFLLLNSVNFIAQRTSSSPYSYFGIGDQFSPRTVEQNSMGGIGVAFNHYKYLNFTNPAAFADLRLTTYTFGLLNSDLTVKSGTAEQNSTSTSLSYVALAFPVGKSAGLSFGLQPVSAVGYSLSNTVLVDGTITEGTAYSGSGGINRFYGSFGIKVYKGLSLGIEAGFSFGDIENSITKQILGASLGTRYNETINLRGTSVKFGAQYQKELENKLMLTAGATVKLENSLDVEGNDYLYSFRFTNSGAESPRDTLSSTLIDGQFNLPLKSNFGVGLGKLDKWYAGVEYESQNAIGSTDLLTNTTGAYRYGKSNRISLGGFYLPKVNSISSYWQRVTYRAGVRYENTGLLVDGSGNTSNFTEINDFGISFGLGLPLKGLSTANMGFEFGKRGTIENNLIQENYFNFRLSLSLTASGVQSWFIKRKID